MASSGPAQARPARCPPQHTSTAYRCETLRTHTRRRLSHERRTIAKHARHQPKGVN